MGRCCLNVRFEWLNACERAIPFYTGSARFSPGDSSIASDYLAKSLGETVHFLRSAHHGYGIAIAHFPLGDSQNSHLQWTKSLGEMLHFSCRKVMFHLVYWTGCNPKPCTKSILTACTSCSILERNVHLVLRFPSVYDTVASKTDHKPIQYQPSLIQVGITSGPTRI